MDSYRRGRPWGKLVKVDSSETVLLFNRECTVGRKKGRLLSVRYGMNGGVVPRLKSYLIKL